MRLSKLIGGLKGCAVRGSADVEVCDIAYNTANVSAGVCFVAVRGTKADGHDFVGEALERGASVIVSERPLNSGNAVNVVVENSRTALAFMSAAFFGEPSRSIKLIGVTGTNGKTTITWLLEAILKEAGWKPGVIGTIEYRFGGTSEPAPHTTPESYDLQKLFSRMKEARIDSCAMEVSSHALAQNRVDGCRFDAAVFTNLSHEHLDYHGDMDSYFEAKAVLFEELLAAGAKRGAFAVINADDDRGTALAKRCPVPVVFYGLTGKAEVKGVGLEFDACGLKMSIECGNEKFEVSSRLTARFNALNILAAVATSRRLGVGSDLIKKAISKMAAVPGRFESIENGRGIIALVDYAHTPDAMENVLMNAREMTKDGGRLIAVFGCGGDRDRGKRPIMGEIAARNADVVFVTSDNPRSEDPNSIINGIMAGMSGYSSPLNGERGYEIVPDRREAIEKAVNFARKGDVLVVAGKGHEDYQIVGDRKMHFDDREVLRELLK